MDVDGGGNVVDGGVELHVGGDFSLRMNDFFLKVFIVNE